MAVMKEYEADAENCVMYAEELPSHCRVNPNLMRVNWRKEKRWCRISGNADEVYHAYLRGQWDAINRRAKRNIYHPGKRHNEYERGYDEEKKSRELNYNRRSYY